MSTLEVRDLTVRYGNGSRARIAVDDVSLTVPSGTTLGLVGESGSGKSSVAAAVVGLVRPVRGSVLLDGADVLGRSAAARRLRRRVQMVFQDPFSSLDPRMPVGASIAEGTRATGRGWERSELTARVRELLDQVGVDPERAGDRPSAFSGGQRQRITIARALAGEPSVLVADEITSALDVSIQSRILNLVRDLQNELDLTVLFISHNLAVVRYVSDQVAVMRDGQVIESGTIEQVIDAPQHSFTQDLIGAVPVLGRPLEV